MLDQATHLRRLVESGAMATAVPPSVRSGRVSFAPDRTPEKSIERASEQKRDQTLGTSAAAQPVRMARAIAVTSGKGGVGKSNLAVNLSVALGALGRRVCLIDADLGLANADVLCSVTPRLTLDDVVHGRCRLGEALLYTPAGFHLMPGASGVTRMADLPPDRHAILLKRLTILERAMDTLIIDTGAGISRSVIAFAAAAHTVLVTVTPEPTSITDGYGLIKALVRQSNDACIEVIVNMAQSEDEARNVFSRLDRVSRTFLSRHLAYGGFIPDDPAVREAVRRRVPFTMLAPKSPASRRVASLARRLVEPPGAATTCPRGGFMGRVAHWLRRGPR